MFGCAVAEIPQQQVVQAARPVSPSFNSPGRWLDLEMSADDVPADDVERALVMHCIGL